MMTVNLTVHLTVNLKLTMEKQTAIQKFQHKKISFLAIILTVHFMWQLY